MLADSPFAGEGYRKVRARLRREHGVHASGNESYGCCAVRGCSLHNGLEAGADPARMTARSSPTAQPAVGHRRHHGLDPS